MNQIRDAKSLIDALEKLAKRDELTPERFAAITQRVVECCEALASWAAQVRGNADAEGARAQADNVAALLVRMRDTHAAGLLEPTTFEATLHVLHLSLGWVERWTERAPAPQGAPASDPDAALYEMGFHEISGLPLCQVRFPPPGTPKHITGVIIGGRA